jgi:hypothetical protein
MQCKKMDTLWLDKVRSMHRTGDGESGAGEEAMNDMSFRGVVLRLEVGMLGTILCWYNAIVPSDDPAATYITLCSEAAGVSEGIAATQM